MTDRSSGLRFDIYERVHLPDDVAAIDELEEIELVPHMQALKQADQLLLKGHLLLAGVYRSSERGSEAAKLEHWIPVEISLPPSRVERVEDLAVEIDNFDVDLLSTRSLNVTGVLALRGLQEEPPQPAVWRDDSFTVVHQAQEAALPDADWESAYPGIAKAIAHSGSVADDAASGSPIDSADEQAALAAAVQADISSSASAAEQAEQTDLADLAEREQTEPASEEAAKESFRWPSDAGWGDISSDRDPLGETGKESAPAEPLAQEPKPEVKIALGVKPAESPSSAGVDWLSMLGDKRGSASPESHAVPEADEEPGDGRDKPAQSTTGDELEWTRLFLSAEGDAESQYKVRMCIVQREDTIEGIAARYNVQPRELQLRNRLNEPYLSEGQVLYIP